MIQDSGNRREFESGAVRDMAEGKGRCDLLPLDIISELYSVFPDTIPTAPQNNHCGIFENIGNYVKLGETKYLYYAILEFCNEIINWDFSTAVIEVSKQYEEGCQKYGDRNWEKGIPLHCYIDSGVRHLLKYLRGDNDERHDRAFLWNMFGALWTAKHKPDCIDLPFNEKVKNHVEEFGRTAYKFGEKKQSGTPLRE